MPLVFVYGSLKQGFGNSHLLAQARKLGDAISVSATYVMWSAGYFPMVTDLVGGDKLSGELYEVSRKQLARLDRLEGHPNFYRRWRRRFVTAAGQTIQAWVYLVPSRHYDGQRGIVPQKGVLEWRKKPAVLPYDENESYDWNTY